MPASHGAAAIEARVREMVLVTKASGSPASRNHHSAAAYWSQAAAGPPPAIGCPPWERPGFPPCTRRRARTGSAANRRRSGVASRVARGNTRV